MSQLSIEWVLESRVIYLRLEGRITGDELIRYDDEMVSRLDHVGADLPVHFIEDVKGLTNAPPLTAALKLKMLRDPRLGWSISIGAVRNPVLRLIYQSLMVTMGIRWRDVASLQQALEYLHRVDDSLPDLAGWESKEHLSSL